MGNGDLPHSSSSSVAKDARQAQYLPTGAEGRERESGREREGEGSSIRHADLLQMKRKILFVCSQSSSSSSPALESLSEKLFHCFSFWHAPFSALPPFPPTVSPTKIAISKQMLNKMQMNHENCENVAARCTRVALCNRCNAIDVYIDRLSECESNVISDYMV